MHAQIRLYGLTLNIIRVRQGKKLGKESGRLRCKLRSWNWSWPCRFDIYAVRHACMIVEDDGEQRPVRCTRLDSNLRFYRSELMLNEFALLIYVAFDIYKHIALP